jgi:hypothetical protein
MDKKEKPLNYKDPNKPMTLSEAEHYLREIDEWHSVSTLPREIIINWATFLKKIGAK